MYSFEVRVGQCCGLCTDCKVFVEPVLRANHDLGETKSQCGKSSCLQKLVVIALMVSRIANSFRH